MYCMFDVMNESMNSMDISALHCTISYTLKSDASDELKMAVNPTLVTIVCTSIIAYKSDLLIHCQTAYH